MWLMAVILGSTYVGHFHIAERCMENTDPEPSTAGTVLHICSWESLMGRKQCPVLARKEQVVLTLSLKYDEYSVLIEDFCKR